MIPHIFIAAVARHRFVVKFKAPRTKSTGFFNNLGEGPDLQLIKWLSLLPHNSYADDLCSTISIFFASMTFKKYFSKSTHFWYPLFSQFTDVFLLALQSRVFFPFFHVCICFLNFLSFFVFNLKAL